MVYTRAVLCKVSMLNCHRFQCAYDAALARVYVPLRTCRLLEKRRDRW
jgi:hypothetical protein